MKVHKCVFSGECLELVRGRSEVEACFLLKVGGNLLSETDVRVETSTDCSASLSDLIDILK